MITLILLVYVIIIHFFDITKVKHILLNLLIFFVLKLNKGEPYLCISDKDIGIDKAIQCLQEADYVGYFKELDLIMPSELSTLYNELQNKFIVGKCSATFSQRLHVFAEKVRKYKKR